MKYLKKFQTNTDYQAYKTGGNYITPNVSIISEGDTIMFEPAADAISLITFTISGTEYQAEEGMTWGEWVNSKYNIDNYLIYNTLIANSSVSRNVINTGTGSVFYYDIIKYTTYYSVMFEPEGGGCT